MAFAKRDRALVWVERERSRARVEVCLRDEGFVVEVVTTLAEVLEAGASGQCALVFASVPQSQLALRRLVAMEAAPGGPALVFVTDVPVAHAGGRWPCAFVDSRDSIGRAIQLAYASRDERRGLMSAHFMTATAELTSLSHSSAPASEIIDNMLAIGSQALGARIATLVFSPTAQYSQKVLALSRRAVVSQGARETIATCLGEARPVWSRLRGGRTPGECFAAPVFGARDAVGAIAFERRGSKTLGRGAGALVTTTADLVSAQLERARLGDVLEHRDRLATFGELMASVAHELNSPLAYTRSNLASLARLIASPKVTVEEIRAEAASILTDCMEGTERIAVMVDSLRSGSRQQGAWSIVDLIWVAQRAAALVKGTRTMNATLRHELEPSAMVRGDFGRLLQVVLNLINNAVQAAGGAGIVTLRTGEEQGVPFLEVEDSGPGVPLELREKIFEAFFTTKPAEIGTGLGLSISRRIARDHGGDLVLRQRPGMGAVFRLTLPPYEVAATPRAEGS